MCYTNGIFRDRISSHTFIIRWARCVTLLKDAGKTNNLTFISCLGDINIDNLQLTFPASGQSQILCSSVSIINDDRLEDEEVFCLTLNSPDLGVVAGTNAITCIVVEDISSKCISNQLSGPCI